MAYLRIGICLCLLGLVYGLGGRRTGGLSTRVFSIDQTATDVVNSVKNEIRGRLTAGDVTDIFEPISYKTQLVAGTNYFVKIKTAADRYIHARIYRDFSGNTSLSDVQTGKSLADEISYF
ncbi:cystatin-A2-like [Ostrea edulis]|uniref:cystatin-A2-like n=1 Tax=Ostrea edulis TaxID=37623 RepID=UPI002096263B|nr:cystatin-A2-like [Ostrea edulis]